MLYRPFTLYTGIMSSAGYNCENVYNHEIFITSLLLVRHLTNCLIWLEVKKKKNTSLKCTTTTKLLIEFVEVPLEFNIIF